MMQGVYPGYYYQLAEPNVCHSGLFGSPVQYHEPMIPVLYRYQCQCQYHDPMIDNAIFGSDEFRMYGYKVKRCPRMRAHDWTECPYAHRGEKAQRRDPRKYAYVAIVCPAFRRTGHCRKGDSCEFAHGVFEYWLHPAKYRTSACNILNNGYCPRKVCFFAHSPDQLRPEHKYSAQKYFIAYQQAGYYPPNQYFQYQNSNNDNYDHVYRASPRTPKANLGGGGVEVKAPLTVEENQTMMNNKKIVDESRLKVEEFLNNLRALRLSDYEMEYDQGEIDAACGMKSYGGGEASVSEMPQFDWITELLQ
ncbi:hypothetical protein PS1_001640 [Malus domestica]